MAPRSLQGARSGGTVPNRYPRKTGRLTISYYGDVMLDRRLANLLSIDIGCAKQRTHSPPLNSPVGGAAASTNLDSGSAHRCNQTQVLLSHNEGCALKAYVAVTNKRWFRHLRMLSRQTRVAEVNFWTPKRWGGRFRVLRRGQPLLFKLTSPDNAIAGGGFFEHYSNLPISLAWQAFGENNGASSLAEVRQRTARLRRDDPRPWEDYTIGCILLAEPFFWDREDWIPQPADWAPSIQRGKGYDLTTQIGQRLWAEVLARLRGATVSELKVDLPGGYTDPATVRRRVGQGIFRAVVTDVYGRQCAVTREKALPALDAAHIRPFSVAPQNYISNGILLRSDIHRLFDAGYVTVTPDYHVRVSDRIHADFHDGENYRRLDGTELWVPSAPEHQPGHRYLEWHNENCFRG